MKRVLLAFVLAAAGVLAAAAPANAGGPVSASLCQHGGGTSGFSVDSDGVAVRACIGGDYAGDLIEPI